MFLINKLFNPNNPHAEHDNVEEWAENPIVGEFPILREIIEDDYQNIYAENIYKMNYNKTNWNKP